MLDMSLSESFAMGWFMSKFVSFRQDRHVLALNAVEILLISTILVQHTLQK